jgi:hypothetical protein
LAQQKNMLITNYIRLRYKLRRARNRAVLVRG